MIRIPHVNRYGDLALGFYSAHHSEKLLVPIDMERLRKWMQYGGPVIYGRSSPLPGRDRCPSNSAEGPQGAADKVPRPKDSVVRAKSVTVLQLGIGNFTPGHAVTPEPYSFAPQSHRPAT